MWITVKEITDPEEKQGQIEEMFTEEDLNDESEKRLPLPNM